MHKKTYFLLFFISLSFLTNGQSIKIGDNFILSKRAYSIYDFQNITALEKWQCVIIDSSNNKDIVYYFVDKKHDTVDISVSQMSYDKNPKFCYSVNDFNLLVKQIGINNTKKILYNNVWIGMSKNNAILSWGKPNDINTTITKNITVEQWVYGDNSNSYLYFTNGKLTAIQN